MKTEKIIEELNKIEQESKEFHKEYYKGIEELETSKFADLNEKYQIESKLHFIAYCLMTQQENKTGFKSGTTKTSEYEGSRIFAEKEEIYIKKFRKKYRETISFFKNPTNNPFILRLLGDKFLYMTIEINKINKSYEDLMGKEFYEEAGIGTKKISFYKEKIKGINLYKPDYTIEKPEFVEGEYGLNERYNKVFEVHITFRNILGREIRADSKFKYSNKKIQKILLRVKKAADKEFERRNKIADKYYQKIWKVLDKYNFAHLLMFKEL